MYFGTHGQLSKLTDIKVYAGQSVLDRVDRFKYLGVVLDQHLTFSYHIDYLKSKTLEKISLLGRARHFVDHDTSIMLYKTLILPYYDYCDVVYHCLSQKDNYTLQKLQNCSLRQILKYDKLSPVSDMHSICNIEMLDMRRDRHVSHDLYRATHDIAPASIQNMFKYVHDTHSKQTRSHTSELLYLPRCKLEFSKRNFKYRGVLYWNPLPENLRHSQSLATFKKHCMSYYSELG